MHMKLALAQEEQEMVAVAVVVLWEIVNSLRRLSYKDCPVRRQRNVNNDVSGELPEIDGDMSSL